MANLDCQPAEYLQIFNNIDPGLITLATALSKFQPFVLQAANSTATAASLGAFGRDAACLSRCRSRSLIPVQHDNENDDEITSVPASKADWTSEPDTGLA